MIGGRLYLLCFVFRRNWFHANIAEMIQQVKAVSDTSCAVGFGISTPELAKATSKIADGVMIDSAIVKIVAHHGRDSIEPVQQFVHAMKEKMSC